MVLNFNTKILSDAARQFNIRNGEFFDNAIGNKLIPVVDVTPIADIVRSAAVTNATTSLIYTTPTDKDFYLTAVTLSYQKDAGNASILLNLNVYINSIVRSVASIYFLPSSANSETITLSFPYPIKLDRGQIIQTAITDATANITHGGVIVGFLSDTNGG